MIFRVADVVRWLVDSGYGVAVTRDDVPLTIEQAARWEVDCTGLDDADDSGHDGRRGDGAGAGVGPRGGRSAAQRMADTRSRRRGQPATESATPATESATPVADYPQHPQQNPQPKAQHVAGESATKPATGCGSGGVGGAGLACLPLNELKPAGKPSLQAQRAHEEPATPVADYPQRNLQHVAGETATSATSATPVTLGFHPVLLGLGDQEGLGVPSANAEAKWRKLADEPNSGVGLRDGLIVIVSDLAIAALKVEAAKARHSKPRDPWAWVLPGFGEGYARACEAFRLRREPAPAPVPALGPTPPVVIPESAPLRLDSAGVPCWLHLQSGRLIRIGPDDTIEPNTGDRMAAKAQGRTLAPILAMERAAYLLEKVAA